MKNLISKICKFIKPDKKLDPAFLELQRKFTSKNNEFTEFRKVSEKALVKFDQVNRNNEHRIFSLRSENDKLKLKNSGLEFSMRSLSGEYQEMVILNKNYQDKHQQALTLIEEQILQIRSLRKQLASTRGVVTKAKNRKNELLAEISLLMEEKFQLMDKTAELKNHINLIEKESTNQHLQISSLKRTISENADYKNLFFRQNELIKQKDTIILSYDPAYNPNQQEKDRQAETGPNPLIKNINFVPKP